MMGKIELLREAVSRINVHMNATAFARVRSAGMSLERALAADGIATRKQLAMEASSIFQESRNFWLEIWKATEPWAQVQIPIATLAELQGRYITCLAGHLQAEFILGDEGAFKHAVGACTKELRELFMFAAADAFRARSDGACKLGTDAMVQFQAL